MRTPAASSLLSALVLVASTVSPGLARAQSARDGVAYVAMLNTPAGALPASSHGADVAVAPRSVDVLYGRIDYESGSLNNIAIGYGASSGRARLGIQAGTITCSGCDGVVIVRLESEALLVRAGGSAGTLGIGVQPALGIGRSLSERAEGLAITGTVGFPLSFTAGSRWRTTIFATPAAGFGTFTSADADAIGWRPLVGGGVRMRGPNGMGVLAGVQRVLMPNAGRTLYGLSVTMPVGGR